MASPEPEPTPTLTIADAAAAALEQKRAQEEEFAEQYEATLIAVCRDVLRGLMGDLVDVDALHVEHVDTDADMVVLADPTAPLAVYEDGRVQPVTLTDDAWTATGPVVCSLAELGEVLAASDSEEV